MECTRDDDNLCLLFYNGNIFLSPFLFLMHLATRCTCWNHLSLYFSLSSLRQTFIGVFKHLLSPFLSRRKIDFGSNACEDSNPNRFGEKFVLEMWKQVLPWKSYEFKMSQFRISREMSLSKLFRNSSDSCHDLGRGNSANLPTIPQPRSSVDGLPEESPSSDIHRRRIDDEG